jgi:hypothetical protein
VIVIFQDSEPAPNFPHIKAQKLTVWYRDHPASGGSTSPLPQVYESNIEDNQHAETSNQSVADVVSIAGTPALQNPTKVNNDTNNILNGCSDEDGLNDLEIPQDMEQLFECLLG